MRGWILRNEMSTLLFLEPSEWQHAFAVPVVVTRHDNRNYFDFSEKAEEAQVYIALLRKKMWYL